MEHKVIFTGYYGTSQTWNEIHNVGFVLWGYDFSKDTNYVSNKTNTQEFFKDCWGDLNWKENKVLMALSCFEVRKESRNNNEEITVWFFTISFQWNIFDFIQQFILEKTKIIYGNVFISINRLAIKCFILILLHPNFRYGPSLLPLLLLVSKSLYTSCARRCLQ